MGCPCGCSPESYARVSGPAVGQTLAACMVPVADSLRDLYTQMGLRPYRVRIVRTRWTGGRRGVGQEALAHEMELSPTPLVQDLSGVGEVLTPVGLDEQGTLTVTEISGRYTEDDLRGWSPHGEGPGPEEQVYWEVEFERAGERGQRRRFLSKSAPSYSADRFQWTVLLERARDDRQRSGEVA